MPNLHLTRVGFLPAGDEIHQCGLPQPVGPGDSHNGARRHIPVQLLKEHLAVVSLAESAQGKHFAPQSRAEGDSQVYLICGNDLGCPLDHFLVGRDAGLRFGAASLRGGANPLEFPGNRLQEVRVRAALHGPLLLLGGKKIGVVALVGFKIPVVQLEHSGGHTIEEIAIVSDQHVGPWVVGKKHFEPCDGIRVEVIGGLVENEQIRLREQNRAEGDPALLASREHSGRLFPGRQAQGLHGLLDLCVQSGRVHGVAVLEDFLHFPLLGQERIGLFFALKNLGVFPELQNRLVARDILTGLGHRFFYVLPDRFFMVQFRLLGDVPHRCPSGNHHTTFKLGIPARNDLHQGRFPRAVDTENPHPVAGPQAEAHILQDHPVAELAPDMTGIENGLPRIQALHDLLLPLDALRPCVGRALEPFRMAKPKTIFPPTNQQEQRRVATAPVASRTLTMGGAYW